MGGGVLELIGVAVGGGVQELIGVGWLGESRANRSGVGANGGVGGCGN